jgi:hypothetical protein
MHTVELDKLPEYAQYELQDLNKGICPLTPRRTRISFHLNRI